jgi:hypothetical protein
MREYDESLNEFVYQGRQIDRHILSSGDTRSYAPRAMLYKEAVSKTLITSNSIRYNTAFLTAKPAIISVHMLILANKEIAL